MEFLTQLTGWFEQIDAWLMAERWRWILAGAIQAGCWGACAFLIWRRSVERRARQLSGPMQPMIQFRARMDDRASPILRQLTQQFGKIGPPAHPNCRSETPQADELERLLDKLKTDPADMIRFDPRRHIIDAGALDDDLKLAEEQRKADQDPPQTFRSRKGGYFYPGAVPVEPDQGGELSEDPDEDWDAEHADAFRPDMADRKDPPPTGEATRPALRPALEGVDIHERANRDKAEMLKSCAVVGVTADEASVALGYLGRALQNSNITVEVENELVEKPRSIYDRGTPFKDMQATGRSTTTMTIRGGDRIVVLKFWHVLDLHRFAKAFQEASEKGLASHIQIAWAWSEFESRHANTEYGGRGWKGGVVVERRPGTPDAIRFRCGSYMMREWGLDGPGGMSPPMHGGKCPACAKLGGPMPAGKPWAAAAPMGTIALKGVTT